MPKQTNESVPANDNKAKENNINNEQIYANINECENKIEKYKEVSKSAENIINEINEFITCLKETDSLLEKIIIGNQPVGKGDLLGTCSSLESIKATFSNIISICNKKIKELENEINGLRSQIKAVK